MADEGGTVVLRGAERERIKERQKERERVKEKEGWREKKPLNLESFLCTDTQCYPRCCVTTPHGNTVS